MQNCFSVSSNRSNTSGSVSSRYPNAEKRVENTVPLRYMLKNVCNMHINIRIYAYKYIRVYAYKHMRIHVRITIRVCGNSYRRICV